MEMIIQRNPAIGQALPGEMEIIGAHAAWTLERVAVAIPAGHYPVKLWDSPHFGRKMPWVQVPGRDKILIHWGNYPQNSDGCILVGTSVDPSTGDIYQTRQKFDELFPPIEAAVETEGCWLTVNDAASNHEDVQDAATGEA